MATIADGVSAGFKQKTEEDKKMITDNLVKYIVGENNTSHKVRGVHGPLSTNVQYNPMDNDFNFFLEICLRISVLSFSEHCHQLRYIQCSRQVYTGTV